MDAFRILHPWYLLLLLAIPLLWYTARQVRVLGRGRKALTLALRSLVILFFILALSEVEMLDRGDTLAVFFAVDRSSSVPQDQQQYALAYVQEQLNQLPPEDKAGILFFGKEAAIQENPGESVTLPEYQALVDVEGTDIESALGLAMAAFQEGMQKRIVLLTDGNQTQGDAVSAAQRAKAAGIDIRILPLEYVYTQEILVEDVVLPPRIREKEPFTVKALVKAQEAGPGKLRLYENGELIAEEDVELQPGKNAYQFTREIDFSGVYNYEAQIEAANDKRPSNNRAQNSALIKGMPRILLIEAEPELGQFLVAALLSEGIQVDMRSPEETPVSIRELQVYDSIILSNVSSERIPPSQQRMIETAVRDLGIGLMMLGGPESFGAGGWQGSPIEDALPVSMDVKQRKIIPSGALALIMHSCEIPQGNYWSQEISEAALNVLGRNDYMGFLRFSMQAGGPAWLFPLAKVGSKREMKSKIQNLRFNDIGDMPSFDNTLQMAYDSLVEVETNVKHIVLLSDGDPAQPTQSLVDKIIEAGITISTVCIAPHSPRDTGVMEELAEYCKGKFYHVKNNKNLPKIFIKEASTIRRNMLVEETFTPRLRQMSEAILGFESGFPPLDGYVVAGFKDQAETVLTSDKEDPLLAHWRYGLGKTAAFTSGPKARWANNWLGWDQYAKFWGQLVRWTLRSTEDENFIVQTSVEGDRVRIAIDAMTEDGEFLNNLDFSGAVLNPALESVPVDIRQTQPGRYEAELSAKEAGSYLMNLSFEQKSEEFEGRLTAGISVPYSPEHSTTKQNDVVLKQLQELSGNPFLGPDQSIFDHNLEATGDIKPLWPLLIALAIVFFFFDIAVRRVFFELTQLEAFFVRVKAQLLYPFTRQLGPVGPATEQLGNLMQAKQRAGERTQVQSVQKEALLQKLESQEGVDEAPETIGAVGDAPWQEVKPGQEAPQFEEEKNEYTSALFRAKQRASSRMKNK